MEQLIVPTVLVGLAAISITYLMLRLLTTRPTVVIVQQPTNDGLGCGIPLLVVLVFFAAIGLQVLSM